MKNPNRLKRFFFHKCIIASLFFTTFNIKAHHAKLAWHDIEGSEEKDAIIHFIMFDHIFEIWDYPQCNNIEIAHFLLPLPHILCPVFHLCFVSNTNLKIIHTSLIVIYRLYHKKIGRQFDRIFSWRR